MSLFPIDAFHEARERVRLVLPETPLYSWPGLCEELQCRFWLKHENHLPVGAFKVRGGVNLVGQLTDEQRERGILACSTGNHGQSLAFAAAHFGVQCTIVVPRGNNPDKNQAIRRLGATLVEQGRDYDEARDYLERELAPRGARYVHSANEPDLILGVGSMPLEIFDRLPQPDVILVPVGLGSGVCANGIVARHLSPNTRIIGVQAEGAAAVAESWKQGQPVTTAEARTWAEGMATRRPAEMTLEIMRQVVDDMVLVDDDLLRQAAAWILKHTHNLAEGAGAAAVAAAWKLRSELAGQTVVGVLSGGNLDLNELPSILNRL